MVRSLDDPNVRCVICGKFNWNKYCDECAKDVFAAVKQSITSHANMSEEDFDSFIKWLVGKWKEEKGL